MDGGRQFPGQLHASILPWTPSHSPEQDGQRLFDALFASPDLRAAWGVVRGSGRCRIGLAISQDAPELHDIPWELLCEQIAPYTRVMLAAASDTPFSRYLYGYRCNGRRSKFSMETSQADITTNTGEQRYHHLFHHVPICIFVAELSAIPATILEVNRKAEVLYGYEATELVGMPVVRLASEDKQESYLNLIEQVRQGKTVMIETISQHRDGTRFPVRMIAAPDPADADRMIVTVEDITAEKQRRSEAEAIAAERRRIAHEIHDGVAHSLAAVRFKSALWHHRADDAPAAMSAALDELQAVLFTAIIDLRRSIFALRPVDLEALSFFPALAQLVGDFGDQYQLVVRLELAGPQDALPVAYELPLFRIIQEGLSNVGQHARASSVLVRLIVDANGCVTVSIRDNGRGFDPSQLGPADQVDHWGLRQMRERILDLGGTLDIHSAPGHGTELVITLQGSKEIIDASN